MRPGRSGLPAPGIAVLRGGGLALAAALALAACGGDGTAGNPSGEASAGADAAPFGEEAGAAPSGSTTAAGQEVDLSGLGANAGDPDAPIRVIEFSDFACPHCRQFHVETYPVIHEEYVETGKVVWKYVPFVLGTFPNSLGAVRAAECAIARDGFTRVRELLFRNQDAWTRASEPVPLFVDYARQASLDPEGFRTCLEERRFDERIQRTLEVARRLRIDGTPTFFIEGRKIGGNRPAAFFRQVFDRILEEGEEGPGV